MARRIIASVICLAAALCVAAPGVAASPQAPDTISVERAFVEMPVSKLDLLSRSTRLDMIDFYNLDSVYNARNAMAGISRLEDMRRGYMKVSLTPVSTLVLKVLPYGNKGAEVVLSNYTIGDSVQAGDSDLEFFDGSMTELPSAKFIKRPELLDFFTCRDKETRRMVERLVPFPTVEYAVSPESGVLTAVLTVGRFMSKEDYDSIKPYLRPRLDYVWDGRRFKMRK